MSRCVFMVRVRVRPLWRWLAGRIAARCGRMDLAFRFWAPCVIEIQEPGRVIRRPLYSLPADREGCDA